MNRHLSFLKLWARHTLHRLGLLDAYLHWRVGPGHVVARQPGQSLADVFSQIYERRIWIESDDQDSTSGAGSTKAVTERIVGQIGSFLNEIECRSVVDIGCGDFNWFQAVEGNFDYLGVDVVPSVVADNNRIYAGDRRRFACLDATREPLDRGDVAICREVLFHLSLEDGRRVLRNVKAAGFRYVLLTHDRSAEFNGDIASGDYRPLNLRKAPFGLPEPERVLFDDAATKGRILGVWPVAALPD